MSNDAVLTLAIFGSTLQLDTQSDAWSDVDFLLVVKDDAYSAFYPSTEWLTPLGELYAYQQSDSTFHSTIRVCFADFRRFDIVITTESSLAQLSDWKSIPFWRGSRLLFSRSPLVTRVLSQTLAAPKLISLSQTTFEEMVNNFWFKAMLASYKIVRNDRLIALHLALDLVRDCCVLGMMLRDRMQDTNFHREGGTGNEVIAPLESAYAATDILNTIEHSAVQFDQLAQEWSPGYREKRYSLLEWIAHIRSTVKVD